MGNRIASEKDRTIYGEYITSGDLIIDTPTKIHSNGNKEVNYYFMINEWPTLRENATIWIDGEKLGHCQLIRFRNSSDETKPWHITSARIKNIPHTQVTAGVIACHGLVNYILDGNSEQYPGLKKWHPNRKFTSKYFGIHLYNNKMFGGHAIEASVLDGGSVKLSGFETQFGFSGVRLNGKEYDHTVESIEIENFYIHDTGHGEGFYLGSTQAGEKAKLKKLIIRNGIISRTACEAIQVQHLIGESDIHNVILNNVDSTLLNAFMGGQDTAIQWVNSTGINKLRNIIIDGFGSVGIITFGSDMLSERAHLGLAEADNILFNNGTDIGIYFHKLCKNGVKWSFKNLYFRNFDNSLYELTGIKRRDFFVSKNNGTDPIKFENITHDRSKSKVFENTSGIEIVNDPVVNDLIPEPQYMNSGFSHEKSIKQWHQFIAKYYPNSKSGAIKIPTKWKKNDVVIDVREDGTYVFCKCLIDHTSVVSSSIVRPKESTQFFLLMWDTNGVRNDQPSWNNSLEQSFFPPDDLRLKPNCYWKQKGFGVQGIIEREEITDHYILDGEEVIVTEHKTYKRGL